jgi:hypothetical protein
MELFDEEETEELSVADELGIDYHTPELGITFGGRVSGSGTIGGDVLAKAALDAAGKFGAPTTAEPTAAPKRRKKRKKKKGIYRPRTIPGARLTPKAERALKFAPHVREARKMTMREALARQGLAANGCPARHVDPVRRQLDAIRAQLILARIQREATSEHNVLNRQSGFRKEVIAKLRKIASCC